MRTIRRDAIVSTLLTLLVATVALAQVGRGPVPGRGRGMGVPRYDPSTEITVNGTVEDVQQLTGAQKGQQSQPGLMCEVCPMGATGTHLTFKTTQGTFNVHVGPATYLASKNFRVAKGDELTITGSKVQFQGTESLIAREIKKGDQILTLRDAQGFLKAGWQASAISGGRAYF